MKKKHYKWLNNMDGTGSVHKTECKQHSYTWNGNTPCTGSYCCIHCGRKEPNSINGGTSGQSN